MGLFQRNPFQQQHEQAALYTIGQERSVLLVGLGNKGKKYEMTRHNAGCMAIDAFAEVHEFPAWQEKKDLKGLVTNQVLADTRVVLLKPQTMMNLSGDAVRATARFFKIHDDEIVIVYDDVDIPFGQIRLRNGGSAGGHNGVKSILNNIDDIFGRVRIGIMSDDKPTQMETSDFVLAKFSKTEQPHLKNMKNEAVSILTEFVYDGRLVADTRNFII